MQCALPSRGRPFATLHALLLWSVVIASIGCRYPATEVLVTMDTDAPADRRMTISVAVVGGGSMAMPDAATFTRGEFDGGIQLPGSFGVTPNGNDDQPVTMTIDAQLAGDADHPPITFRRITRFMFIRRATTAVPVFLAVNCGNATTGCTRTDAAHCTVSQFCEEQNQTCGDDGSCIGQEVVPVPTDGGLTLPVIEAGRHDSGPRVVDAIDVPADIATDVVDAVDRVDVPAVVDAGPPCDASGSLTDPRNCGPCGLVCPVACSAGQCVTVASVTGSRSATCAVLTDGTVRCWGSNGGNVLGIRTRTEYLVPTEITGLTNIVQIGIGSDHGCALTTTHTVLCWGSNITGGLGDGTTNARTTIAPVPGLSDAVEIAVGSRHTCATRMDETVVCWGAGESAQVGPTAALPTCLVRAANGDAGTVANSIPCATRPVAIAGVSGVTSIVAGNSHTCVLMAGAVRCWGGNSQAQLGYATGSSCYGVAAMTDAGMGPPTSCSTTATVIAGISTAVHIAAGGLHTCASLADNSTRCWGHDDEGMLGDGLLADRTANAPVLRMLGSSFILPGATVVAGFDHTGIYGTAGTINLFGSGTEGQIGNGTMASAMFPFQVPGMTDVRTVSLGSYHTCVVSRTGLLRCWGMNANGQIGNGMSGAGVRSLVPVAPQW